MSYAVTTPRHLRRRDPEFVNFSMVDYSKIRKASKNFFSDTLLSWSNVAGNIRDFPWRTTKSPYLILIAELLLRRTNAPAVVPVYNNFIRKYPLLSDFANANPDDLREIVQPLGLNWRAENIVELSQTISSSKMKRLPLTYSALVILPGIGPYVAKALLVNSDSSATVPVDTNVVRLLGRYFGIDVDDNLRRNSKFGAFAESLLPASNQRKFNYALLDLAAGICKSGIPKCSECPLSSNCSYFKSRRAENRQRFNNEQ